MSHVFEERVIKTRTNFVDISDDDKGKVESPPFPSVTVPEEKSFHSPLSCSSMASPSPTQYWIRKSRA